MDSIRVMMLTSKSNLQFVVDEFKDELAREKIVLKVMEDADFDDMFSKKQDVEVDLPDNIFMELAKMAHEKDITLNQLVSNVLREQLEKYEDHPW